MENFLELAASRRSIRKYTDQKVSKEDIGYFIQAAITAPSGCNSQCWRFIAIEDKAVINRIKKAVEDRVEGFLVNADPPVTSDYLTSKKKMATFFANAPLVIAVFMTKPTYYDQTMISALRSQGYNEEQIMELYAHYDLLSVGAAIQNMLLAICEKGYGACWMNEPVIAGDAINRILNVPIEERIISLVPVGISAYTPRDKKFKDIEDVFTMS
jgi:nitroreductase